ncbi:MAG: hypothetical protein Q9169_004373 [Polycauliona sp. 2 TL-2023]
MTGESLDWVNSLGVMPEEKLIKFAKYGIMKLVAWAYRRAGPEHFRLCSDYMHLFWIIDDYTDKVSSEEVEREVASIKRVLADPNHISTQPGVLEGVCQSNPSLETWPKGNPYWKWLADTAKAIRGEFNGSLYAQCERAIKDNLPTGCYRESLMLNQEKLGMTRDEIIRMGAVMMDAGAETTASFLQSLILALINNLGVQEKGQKEIDDVIGPDRWPVLDDFDGVPYIRAIVDEVFRFRAILPVGIPHVSTKAVDYNDYCIPQGSYIFMNIYGLFHDPEVYHDPDSFDPERFLRTPFGVKEGVDTKGYRNNFAFGAGLRICPGESMARRTIALNTMHLLWAFDFRQDCSGTGGQGIDSYAKASTWLVLRYCSRTEANQILRSPQPGIELAPKPFTCNPSPRTAAKAEMIRARYAKAFPAREEHANTT